MLARPCLTSGSDQGHNVLAWGQRLSAEAEVGPSREPARGRGQKKKWAERQEGRDSVGDSGGGAGRQQNQTENTSSTAEKPRGHRGKTGQPRDHSPHTLSSCVPVACGSPLGALSRPADDSGTASRIWIGDRAPVVMRREAPWKRLWQGPAYSRCSIKNRLWDKGAQWPLGECGAFYGPDFPWRQGGERLF